MFATFVCKHCNNKIVISFSEPSQVPSSCTKCGSKISNSHYITSFADKFSSLQRALHDLEFCGLSSGKSDLVYRSDMEALNDLYTHSSPEVKKMLTRILDTNFLMIYNDAKDEDLEALEKYCSSLRAIFEERIDLKNKEVEELLGINKD